MCNSIFLLKSTVSNLFNQDKPPAKNQNLKTNAIAHDISQSKLTISSCDLWVKQHLVVSAMKALSIASALTVVYVAAKYFTNGNAESNNRLSQGSENLFEGFCKADRSFTQHSGTFPKSFLNPHSFEESQSQTETANHIRGFIGYTAPFITPNTGDSTASALDFLISIVNQNKSKNENAISGLIGYTSTSATLDGGLLNNSEKEIKRFIGLTPLVVNQHLGATPDALKNDSLIEEQLSLPTTTSGSIINSGVSAAPQAELHKQNTTESFVAEITTSTRVDSQEMQISQDVPSQISISPEKTDDTQNKGENPKETTPSSVPLNSVQAEKAQPIEPENKHSKPAQQQNIQNQEKLTTPTSSSELPEQPRIEFGPPINPKIKTANTPQDKSTSEPVYGPQLKPEKKNKNKKDKR